MEVDEFLSELLYLNFNDPESGISNKKHMDWVEKQQLEGVGDYAVDFTDKAEATKLLNFALTILQAVPKTKKPKLNSMTAMMLILYGNKLKEDFGDIVPEKYAKAFFDTYDLWSMKKMYKDEKTSNGNQMPPFHELFGGKNQNAIKTIFKVLDIELEKEDFDFGVIELDSRKTFSPKDIERKWDDQGGLCAITGVPLDEGEFAGDHIVARSMGGKTEYDNLQVIGKKTNIKKSNANNEDYINKIA